MRSLTWREVWGHRLARHALLEPRSRDDLLEVVRAVCGIHAQVMSAAELSIGIRLDGITAQHVRAELWQRRGLVKAHGPRGTVHIFPADELPLWVAALHANLHPNEARRLAQLGLGPAQLETIVTAIGEALDSRCLTRDELGHEVALRVGSWATDAVSPAFGGHWPRWLIALGHAANAGLLCFGPNQGNKVTFVRPDQWLGSWKAVDGAEALREVFRRYLSAYGPATHRDFAQWFSMQPGAALTLFQELAGELEEVNIESYHAWMVAGDDTASWQPAQDVVQLLPHFDCYLLGCHPRDRLVPAAWAQRVLTRGAIGNIPVVVVDGTVAGIWQQRRSGRRLDIQVEMFRSLNARQRKNLEAAAARLGEIVEVQSNLTLGAVDARPHL